jgi:transcriptional regulator with XRE-family HTH domain
MNDIQFRIRKLIKELDLTMDEFSAKIETHQSSLSRALSEGNNVGDAMINKIVIAFGINKNWLLKGEGEMLLDFSKGITGGENPVADKEFDDIQENLSVLNKLILSNSGIKKINDLYEDFEGDVFLLSSYLHEYTMLNKMSDILDCYRDKKVKMPGVVEYFKDEFQKIKELYQIIKPYEKTIKELLSKVSDFNDANDKFYCIDED